MRAMRPLIVDAAAIAATLEPGALIDALARMFADPPVSPDRHHHGFEVPGDAEPGTLLLMPSWRPGCLLGVKLATVIPRNPARGHPTVSGSYLLLDATTGDTLMLADAAALTRKRTAAVSALAARTLARRESRTLLLVGTGGLAADLIEAFASAFALDCILIWARRSEAASAVAAQFPGLPVQPVTDLRAAVREADVVSSATSATAPLMRGAWLRPGTHVDLVGSFTPAMREADAEALQRARVFVDTRAALTEAGEFTGAISTGAWSPDALIGDLTQLVRGEVPGRTGDDDMTLFKAIGTATADLAAATLLWQRLG